MVEEIVVIENPLQNGATNNLQKNLQEFIFL